VSISAGSSRRLVLGAVALLGLCAPSGCVTSTEGEKMQSSIDALRVRLDEIDKRDREYKEQVIRLRKVLDEATALLTRNSADVGAKAAKSEQDIQAIQGRIEELAHNVDLENRQGVEARTQFEGRLAALEQTQGKIIDRVAPEMPSDKDQLWTQAGQRLASGQRDDGRRFYRVFIQRFPQDPRAPQAYLAIGMSFVQESKYANAAGEFQKLLNDYRASPEVPEATWQLSLAFVQLKFCGDARALLADLVKRFPKSARAGDARNELKSIAKLPKSSCTS
jgi:TolA-binding protein